MSKQSPELDFYWSAMTKTLILPKKNHIMVTHDENTNVKSALKIVDSKSNNKHS